MMYSYLGITSILFTRFALGSITASIDKLDSSDQIPLPPSFIVVIDVAIGVSDADAFAGIGIHAITSHGAQFVYARDSNGDAITTAPGIEDRFVTFFSRPRLRNGDGRFGTGASVATSLRYCGGIVSVFTDTQVNAVGLPVGFETGRDGHILRIALDLTNVVEPEFRLDSENILVSTTPLPGAVPLLETECGNFSTGVQVASQFNDNVYFGFGIYGVPEPASALSLLVVTGALLRRR